MRETLQQQTLSVRIGEGLRRKLERARALEIARTGHTVSVSEVAKKLLESGREDRLEVVHLLSDPTAALASIRLKADAGHVLSRAEWTVVCHFVREGLEAFSLATPRRLSAASIVTVVDAFQALLRERPLHRAVRNRTYLDSLTSEHTVTPDVEDEACHQILDDVRQRVLAGAGDRFLLVGRNLATFLEEESAVSAASIDRVLRKYWEGLWLLAARGHYAHTNLPVRVEVAAINVTPPIAPITDGQFTVSVTLGGDAEMALLVSFPARRGLRYPVNGYPCISEFRTMLGTLGCRESSVRRWQGRFFIGDCVVSEDADEVWFRGVQNGISVGFVLPEWMALQSLCDNAWTAPDVAITWRRLARDYGEL